MISIIIVSLNTKTDFQNTINSVISQNEKLELIVIDGKSVDGTLDVIKKNSKLINKLVIEKDDGIYSAMNKGINLASKKWIYFLNSGDVFHSNQTIKNTIKILKKNENFDVIIGNSIVRKKNSLTKSPRKELNNSTVSSCFSHQSAFTKTELLKKYFFNTKYKFASDFDFFLKLFNSKKKFLYIDELISINKSGGISDINRLEVYAEFKEIVFSQNKNLTNIFKINFLILLNLAKKIIKLVLPNSLIDKIIFYIDKKIK